MPIVKGKIAYYENILSYYDNIMNFNSIIDDFSLLRMFSIKQVRCYDG